MQTEHPIKFKKGSGYVGNLCKSGPSKSNGKAVDEMTHKGEWVIVFQKALSKENHLQ